MDRRQFLAATSAALMVPSVARANAQLRAASYYGESNFQGRNFRTFVNEVLSESPDPVSIDMHFSGSLVKLPDMKTAIRTNQIMFGDLLLSAFGNEDFVFGLDAVPFLANTTEQAASLWAAQKPVLQDRLAQEGLRLVYASPWPLQGVLSKEPLESLADFENKSWRSSSPQVGRLGRALGANAVNIDFGEIPTAVATGALDLFMTSAATAVDIAAWDFFNVFTEIGGMRTKTAVLMNLDTFQALPSGLQEVILEAGNNAEARGWKQSDEVHASTVKTLRDNGMAVNEPSEVLAAQLRQIGDELVAEWADEVGEGAAPFLQAVGR